MQKMVSDDPDRGGEIQTSHLAPYGHPIGRTCIQDLLRKPPCFLPEDQVVTLFGVSVCIYFLRVGAECEKRRTRGPFRTEGLKALVMMDVDFAPVIKTGPPQMPVVHPESQGMDKVEPELRRSAKPRYITSV